MKEIWKDVYFIYDEKTYDYRGLYQISNYGNVKSLYYQGKPREKILKCGIDGGGYLFVNLWKDRKSKHFLVHRLVAFMFIENDDPTNKTEVNHINEFEKWNNNVDNLEWCSHKYNNNYGTKNKRSTETKKENGTLYKSNEHCLSKKVCQYDKQGNIIKVWDCINDINRQLGINNSDIVKCCKFWEIGCDKDKWFKMYKHNPVKQAGGFIWKYVNDVDLL